MDIKKKSNTWFCITALLFSPLHAQTNLSGAIGGMTFESSGNPYIINDDISVQHGKTTAIKAGCIFLFREFTGLIIDGSITVAGTSRSPVVFTSITADTGFQPDGQLPNPFDWNGIRINEKASQVNMSHFILSYSVYGIKSLKNDIHLSDGVFRKNGQMHFSLNNTIIPVAEAVPYSYSLDLQAARTPFSLSIRKSALPVILGTAGILAGSGAGYFYRCKKSIRKEYHETTNQTDYDRLGTRESRALTRCVVFAAASALCFTSATTLFTIGTIYEQRSRKKTIALRMGYVPAHLFLTADW